MPFDGANSRGSQWWPLPHPWWGRRVRTADGREGVSQSNPDPAGPYFLIHVRFDDGSTEWFKASTLRKVD